MENIELTPSQRAKKKWAERHRPTNESFLIEMRDSTDGYTPVNGYEQYEINRSGDVYFKGDCMGKIRRKSKFVSKSLLKTGGGYYIIRLNRKQFFLHRLLAEAFIPKPDHLKDIPFDQLEVDHIDGNSLNNSLQNLRWVTHKENLNNPITVQREKKSHIGLVSNIKGRKKVWIDRENNKYKMI